MDAEEIGRDVERGSMSHPDRDPAFVRRLAGHCARLLEAVKKHHAQRADDRCWMDDVDLYAAAGLPPHDAAVGDKVEMLKNCARFVETRCAGGTWRSYAELEAETARLREALTWAVGFIRCNLSKTAETYPDMRNAEDLAASAPLYSGEFHRTAARAELAEAERERLEKALDLERAAARGAVEDALARAYAAGCAAQVAEVCDRVLDRSGALLGRVRDRARDLNERQKKETPNGPTTT